MRRGSVAIDQKIYDEIEYTVDLFNLKASDLKLEDELGLFSILCYTTTPYLLPTEGI